MIGGIRPDAKSRSADRVLSRFLPGTSIGFDIQTIRCCCCCCCCSCCRRPSMTSDDTYARGLHAQWPRPPWRSRRSTVVAVAVVVGGGVTSESRATGRGEPAATISGATFRAGSAQTRTTMTGRRTSESLLSRPNGKGRANGPRGETTDDAAVGPYEAEAGRDDDARTTDGRGAVVAGIRIAIVLS